MPNKSDETLCCRCDPDNCQCVRFNCVCRAKKCLCQCKICKPMLFSFPKDPIEFENWKKACPNVFDPTQKHLLACEWHWPDGYETLSPEKNPHICSRLPKELPSCLQQNFIRKRPTSCLLYTSPSPRD